MVDRINAEESTQYIPQVALGVAKRRNRTLLRDLLEEYAVVEVTDQVPDGTDVCLVDATGFERLREALAAWKRAERPIAAPALLIANLPEDDLWNRYGDAVGESLDALLSIPAPRQAVKARVDAVASVRSKAALAAARYDKLDLYEQAMDGARVGITIADATAEDLPLVYVNDGFCELTGYDRAEALGRNCRFLQGEGTDPATRRQLRDALAAREPVSVEIRNYRRNGDPFWNRLDVVPVETDATVTHFLGFQRDVSDLRRQREQLSVLDRVLRHNLRNKLNVVIGHAQRLMDDPDSDPETVATAAASIHRATTDVLELADAARRFGLATESATATQRDVVNVVEQWAPSRADLELHTDLPRRAPALCPDRLPLCLDTLVEEARDRHPTGTPTVTVTVERTDQRVELRVDADADPIPELERQAFLAGRELPLEHAQGIELWLVRWAVERVGGQVTLDGDGRSVNLSLPAVDA